MPELPEVEAARKAIEKHCLGKKIKRSVIADDSKVIDGVKPSDFEASLLGKTIVSARRKGKNLWLQLDSPPFPSFQFGMAGAIYIKGVAITKYVRSAVNDTDEWPSKYSKLFIELDDGLELSFTDKRRFAKVRLLKDPSSVPPISELGPDALLEPMTLDEFISSLSKKKTAIKALLLDQSYISGIGNWVADEVLYQARIHPLQIAASLSRENCANLNKCIKEVIEKAIEVGADSSQFPNNWIFHSREKKPGEVFVDGKKIEFISAGGRTTAYVPELQKLSGTQTAQAPGKPKRQTSKQNRGGDEDEDDRASEEEENTDNVKSKKGKNPKGGGKKVPAKRKSKKSDGGGGDDDVDDDEDNDYGDRKKKSGKVTENKQAHEDEDEDDKASEEEENTDNVKSKKGKNPKGGGKKVPAKRKSKKSDGGGGDDDVDDDEDNDYGDRKKKSGKVTKNKQAHEDEDDKASEEEENTENVKSKKGKNPKGGGKKVPAKRKSKKSDDDGGSGDDDVDDDEDNDYGDRKKRSGKVTKNKQAQEESTSKKISQRIMKVKKAK